MTTSINDNSGLNWEDRTNTDAIKQNIRELEVVDTKHYYELPVRLNNKTFILKFNSTSNNFDEISKVVKDKLENATKANFLYTVREQNKGGIDKKMHNMAYKELQKTLTLKQTLPSFIRKAWNAAARIFDCFKTNRLEETPFIQREIAIYTSEEGSSGLKVNPQGGAVFHTSVGSDALKEDKQGRNCDKAGLDYSDEGLAILGIADGSGPKLNAMTAAEGVLKTLMSDIKQQKVVFGSDANENKRKGYNAAVRSVDPMYNSKAWNLNDYTYYAGSTTAVFMNVSKDENEQLYVGGFVIGDCLAFTLNSENGINELYRLNREGESISESGGQIRAPNIDDPEEPQGKKSAGYLYENELYGFAATIKQNDYIVAASDGLMDNIRDDEFYPVVEFIINCSAFDEPIPESVIPPNQYQEHETTGEKFFGLPSVDYLENLFNETDSPYDKHNPEVIIATRLTNYVHWVVEGNIKTFESVKALLSDESDKFLLNQLKDLDFTQEEIKTIQDGYKNVVGYIEKAPHIEDLFTKLKAMQLQKDESTNNFITQLMFVIMIEIDLPSGAYGKQDDISIVVMPPERRQAVDLANINNDVVPTE